MTDEQQAQVEQRGLDRFTRNYLIALGVIAGIILLFWLATLDPRVGEINDRLTKDPLVAAYVYPFRVIAINNGIAEISTPRSYAVPVMKFLTLVRPELAGKAQDSPEMMAAQAELVKVQKRVAEIVTGQPDIKRVRWVLDRQWYADRGISLATG